jgi:hypothetical protein
MGNLKLLNQQEDYIAVTTYMGNYKFSNLTVEVFAKQFEID